MTRVPVIDPELRPTIKTPWPVRNLGRGLRLLECDIMGWADGEIVQMVLFEKVAVPLVRAAKETDRIERWRVWEDPTLEGGWIAYVIRPHADDGNPKADNSQQVDMIIGFSFVLFVCVVAAIVTVVLPQCQGG